LRWKGDYKQWVRGVLRDAWFPLPLRTDPDVSRIFFVDVGKILIRLQLRGRGAGTRAQNIDSQALVGKIFRTKELRARIAPGFEKAGMVVEVSRITRTIPF
jgi:hypothetical protein